MEIYKAIAEVALAMSKEGISKEQKCSFGKTSYQFRGIDDIYNALAPVMAKAELVMLPRVLSRTVSERLTVKDSFGKEKESLTFCVSVEVEYDLVSAKDGSKHTIKTYGEAMDTGDKATNKAMSAAYKYACFQTFCIPTEGDNDADATTHKALVARPKIDHEEYLSRYAKIRLNGEPVLFRNIQEYRKNWDENYENIKKDSVNIDVLRLLLKKSENNDFINSPEILSVCKEILSTYFDDKNESGDL